MDHVVVMSEEEKQKREMIKRLEKELHEHGIKWQRKMTVEEMVAHDEVTSSMRTKIAKLMNGVGLIPARMPPPRPAEEPFKARLVPAHLDPDPFFWLRENRYP
jgi:hypothetical protein